LNFQNSAKNPSDRVDSLRPHESGYQFTMLKSLKKASRKISKKRKEKLDPQTGIYTQSNDDLTSSSGSCDSSPHLCRNFPEIRKEVQTKSVAVQTESCEKVGAKPKVNSDLSALYLSFILMLIGFNFSAFVTSFQHHINVFLLLGSIFSGIAVAVFLRRVIGLNLFQTSDKAAERALLTSVTQVRLIYNFLFHGLDSSENYFWSLFLFVLSICILFLDKVDSQKITRIFDHVTNREKVHAQ